MKKFILASLLAFISINAHAASIGYYDAKKIETIVQSELFLNSLALHERIKSVVLTERGAPAGAAVYTNDGNLICSRYIYFSVIPESTINSWNPTYTVKAISPRHCSSPSIMPINPTK